jgi:hypothetical protein
MNQSEFTDRIQFLEDERVMEVDFSELTFDSSAMVDSFYDEVDRRISESGHDKWYFLVNYRNCRIFELAWIRFAQRGKRVNLAASLGSVRYAVREDLGQSIESSAQRENFDPNLFKSREEALAEIRRMRSEA